MSDPLSIVASTITVAGLAGAIMQATRDLDQNQLIAEDLSRDTRRVVIQLLVILSGIKRRFNAIKSDYQLSDENEWCVHAKTAIKEFGNDLERLRWLTDNPKRGIHRWKGREKLERDIQRTWRDIQSQIRIIDLVIPMLPLEGHLTHSRVNSSGGQGIGELNSPCTTLSVPWPDSISEPLANDFLNDIEKDKGDATTSDIESEQNISIDTNVLIAAVKAGKMDKVRIMLGEGADVTAPDGDGWAAIHHCAFRGQADMLQMIIESRDTSIKEILNAVTKIGRKCPLHLAAENDRYEFARLALQHGADPQRHDEDERTPYGIADEYNRFNFMEVIEELSGGGAENH